LATAFSQFLAAIIAQFTSVTSESGLIPPPIETVRVYGTVFGQIALMALGSALICFCLVPLLKKWMNEEKAPEPQPSDWQDYNPPGDEQRQA
jgi:dipeptide/tripeptide permease